MNMERGSVIDAQITFISNNYLTYPYFRIINHRYSWYIGYVGHISAINHDANKREDDLYYRMNREYHTKLLDEQRIII